MLFALVVAAVCYTSPVWIVVAIAAIKVKRGLLENLS